MSLNRAKVALKFLFLFYSFTEASCLNRAKVALKSIREGS